VAPTIDPVNESSKDRLLRLSSIPPDQEIRDLSNVEIRDSERVPPNRVPMFMDDGDDAPPSGLSPLPPLEEVTGPPPQPTIMRKADAKVVLVADDDDAIRELVIRALGTTYTIYEARDGNEALDLLKRIRPLPDAVVSDVMMPGMDGFELAKAVKSHPHLRKVPLIFITARGGAMDVVQGINAGARHYIQKPFKLKELLDKVGQVIGGK
jgi:CheY-like chemotaxis protein